MSRFDTEEQRRRLMLVFRMCVLCEKEPAIDPPLCDECREKLRTELAGSGLVKRDPPPGGKG